MRPSRRQIPLFTRPWPTGQPSATAVLIALTAVAATAEWLFVLLDSGQILQDGTMNAWLGLSATTMAEGRYWQIGSFILLHAPPFPLHIAVNLAVLYFAGREVEPILGTRHLLGLFFGGNFIGGLFHWFAGAQGWIDSDVALVGISPGVAAVLVAFATILPELELPSGSSRSGRYTVRAKFLGLGTAACAGLMLTTGTALAVGPDAMLAASLLGWGYVKKMGFGSPLAFQRFVFNRRQRQARLARMPVEQFICEEIDPILEKISREGIQSLSRAERKLLDQGKEKIKAREMVGS